MACRTSTVLALGLVVSVGRVSADDFAFVEMKPGGIILVAGEPVTLETLGAALRAARDGDLTGRVMIRAEPGADYSTVREVMNALQAAGFTKTALVAEQR